jgi:hypothetical protein
MPPARRPLVDEESSLRRLAIAADVEGVDYVVESEPDGGLGQLGVVQLAAVTGSAGIQEPAPGRRGLPVLGPEVLADGGGVRDGQVVQGNECLLLSAKL